MTLLVWHRAERRSARPGLIAVNKLAGLFSATAVLVVLWQAGQAMAKLAIFAWLAFSPPGPGVPSFQREYDGTKYARPMTGAYRQALWRFPDRLSCLQAGADPSTAKGLSRLDWDSISTTEEAEVCLFRLISGLPGGMPISKPLPWHRGSRCLPKASTLPTPT